MLIAAIIISLVLALFYFSLFQYFRKGWERVPEFPPKERSNQPGFSIIIPARNEAGNIQQTLRDIIGQDYTGPYEIIVVDDHSEDDTAEVVATFIQTNRQVAIRLIRMQELVEESSLKAHKKASIEAAIKISQHDWIVTTDADCRRGKGWLSTLAAFVSEYQPILVSMPVKMSPYLKTFQQMLALEFLGLIGIGAASIGSGSPNMCNGANLCYRKSAFYEVGGFRGIDDIASGDDEFLMHKIFERWPQGVFFLKNTDAIVETLPVETLADFIQQRKRWVSKSRKYSRKSITAVLVGAYLYHLALLGFLIIGFFQPLYFGLAAFLWLVKWLSEEPFLNRVSSWMREKPLMKNYFPASLLYTVYVLFIGIYGNFGTYNWKGRKLR